MKCKEDLTDRQLDVGREFPDQNEHALHLDQWISMKSLPRIEAFADIVQVSKLVHSELHCDTASYSIINAVHFTSWMCTLDQVHSNASWFSEMKARKIISRWYTGNAC